MKDKFLLTEAQSVQVVLEEDGTEVDDDECQKAIVPLRFQVTHIKVHIVNPLQPAPQQTLAPTGAKHLKYRGVKWVLFF